jgi:muramoyltetrapeptide carboxypeptidase LdcA involved in peptidoglycan recycling
LFLFFLLISIFNNKGIDAFHGGNFLFVFSRKIHYLCRKQRTEAMKKLTAQNTQANKDLNEAKDKARQLEKQLSETLAKGGSNIWMIIAIIAALAFVAVLIFK